MDADKRGKNFLVVSRGGNYVIRASIGTDFKLTTLDANNVARRFQTGNLPSGVVMARSGKRAYANNELNTSVSALNLEDNTVIARDIESSAPPAPGTQAHRNLVGKLAFFTALGLPDKLDNTGDGSSTSRCATSIRWPIAARRRTTPGRAAPRATTTATPTT